MVSPLGLAAYLLKKLSESAVDGKIQDGGNAMRNSKKASVTKKPKPQYYAVSQLKLRGWTDKMVESFLGEPDELRVNPHYGSGPPMKLYEVKRVERKERTKSFRASQDARMSRRDAAQKAIATKQKKLAEYVASIIVEVPQIADDELIRRACEHYNARSSQTDFARASETSDPEFLERICVNYLRHCLTSYEDHLRAIFGKVGTDDAYLQIKDKVLDAIADEYDWLIVECGKQSGRMWEQAMSQY